MRERFLLASFAQSCDYTRMPHRPPRSKKAQSNRETPTIANPVWPNSRLSVVETWPPAPPFHGCEIANQN
jgi:hypothetical protein